MVMSWIPSNTDAIYGLYFNFLSSMNIIYFDIVQMRFHTFKSQQETLG